METRPRLKGGRIEGAYGADIPAMAGVVTVDRGRSGCSVSDVAS